MQKNQIQFREVRKVPLLTPILCGGQSAYSFGEKSTILVRAPYFSISGILCPSWSRLSFLEHGFWLIAGARLPIVVASFCVQGEPFVGTRLTTSHAHARLPSWMLSVRGGLPDCCSGGVPVVGNVEGLGGRKPGISMRGAQEERERGNPLQHNIETFKCA